MMTFEEMTEVPERDEIMTDVNSLLGFFLSLFIDIYHVWRSKGNRFAGKNACVWQVHNCVYTVHETTSFQSQLVTTLTNPVASVDHGSRWLPQFPQLYAIIFVWETW